MPVDAKNIWVAAGDGDLCRVQELVETASVSPNAPDQFSYTPMHAAASYSQLEVLQYLISHGGDINIVDDDGETPLYTVETVAAARLLVENGAAVDHRNNEGVTPAEYLSDDFPEISAFLVPHLPDAPCLTRPLPSEHDQHIVSERLTSQLMTSVHGVMQRAEAESRNPDDDLRRVISETVLNGVALGHQMSADVNDTLGLHVNGVDSPPNKRQKMEGS